MEWMGLKGKSSIWAVRGVSIQPAARLAVSRRHFDLRIGLNYSIYIQALEAPRYHDTDSGTPQSLALLATSLFFSSFSAVWLRDMLPLPFH